MAELLPLQHPRRPCSYCGQELRADHYFCPACSQPWRPGDANLGPTPEPVWDDETRVRLKAPEAYHLFFCYLAAVFIAAISTQLMSADKGSRLPYYVISGLAVMAVTLWAGIRHWGVLRPILRRPGITHVLFIPGLLMGAALIGLNFLYHGWLQQFLTGSHNKEEAFGEGLPLTAGFFLLCLIPAITEEIGFRGLMQTILLRALPLRRALFLSSLLFAAAHFSVLSFPYLFLFGVLCGWLLHRTGSVYPGIIIHTLHNFVVILYSTS